jgi:hypothetical protein
LARLLPTVLVVALLGGTAAAFAVTEHLKLVRSPILHTRVGKLVAPGCRCNNGRVKIAFRLRKGDRMSVVIVDSNGRVVRTVRAARGARPGPVAFFWDGRADDGSRVRDGTYRPRVHLYGQHRTILLPNPILVDTKPPSVSIVSVRPRVFSPDFDRRRDYIRVRWRADEPVHTVLFVDGRPLVRVRYLRRTGEISWYGHAFGRALRAGVHRVYLRARDRAGNLGPATAPRVVRARYIRLARHVIRARAGGRLAVRVFTDSAVYRWRFAGRAATVRRKTLVLRADTAGRFRLVVSERGHSDSALVVVAP